MQLPSQPVRLSFGLHGPVPVPAVRPAKPLHRSISFPPDCRPVGRSSMKVSHVLVWCSCVGSFAALAATTSVNSEFFGSPLLHNAWLSRCRQLTQNEYTLQAGVCCRGSSKQPLPQSRKIPESDLSGNEWFHRWGRRMLVIIVPVGPADLLVSFNTAIAWLR